MNQTIQQIEASINFLSEARYKERLKTFPNSKCELCGRLHPSTTPCEGYITLSAQSVQFSRIYEREYGVQPDYIKQKRIQLKAEMKDPETEARFKPLIAEQIKNLDNHGEGMHNYESHPMLTAKQKTMLYRDRMEYDYKLSIKELREARKTKDSIRKMNADRIYQLALRAVEKQNSRRTHSKATHLQIKIIKV